MNRGYEVGEYLEFLDRARAFLHQPELGRPLTLAGDIIVGFPTETEADFEATRTLLERARYKNCFIFKYSPRPGTVAIDRLEDDVPDAVKRRRNNDLLAVQNRISDEVGREFVGRTLDVFVQGVSRKTVKARRAAAKTHGGVGLTVGGRALPGESEPDGCDGAACGDGASHVERDDGASSGPLQMTARTDGDLIVLFDAPRGVEPEDLIGTVRAVRVTGSRPLALLGSLS